MLDSKFVTKV